MVRKAETENDMQVSHFKVTFLIKVKAEVTSSFCQPKLACEELAPLFLSLLISGKAQTNNLILAWWPETSVCVTPFWLGLLDLEQELNPNQYPPINYILHLYFVQ